MQNGRTPTIDKGHVLVQVDDADPTVIVCGHSGCGGSVVAHGLPDPAKQANDTSDTPLMRFIDPIVRLRHAVGTGCSVDQLIEENVKRGVENVCNSPVRQKRSSRRAAPGENGESGFFVGGFGDTVRALRCLLA